MASIAKLVVSLGANVAGFETDMQRATRNQKKRMREMEQTAAAAGKALAVAFTAAAGAMTAIVVSSTKTADQMQKLAQRTGLTTEALSEYKHVAELSGVSFDQFTNGMKRMQRSISDAEVGLSTQTRAFERLGISVDDLIQMSPDKQFETIAAAMGGLENATLKSATAQEIFGRAGTELLSVMNDGTEGITAMRDEAVRLGLSIGQEFADNSALFNDNITRMKAGFEGAGNALTEGLLPALIGTQEYFLSGSTSMDTFRRAGEKLGEVIQYLVRAFTLLWGLLRTIAAALIGIVQVVLNATQAMLAPIKATIQALAEANDALARGDFSGAMRAMGSISQKTSAQMTKAMKGMKRGIDEVTGAGIYWNDALKKSASLTESTADATDKMVEPLEDVAESADKASEKMQKLIDAYNNKQSQFEFNQRMKDIADTINEATEELDELVAEQDRMTSSTEALIRKLYPAEAATKEFIQQLKDLREYADQNTWSAEQLADAEVRLAKDFAEATASIGKQKKEVDLLATAIEEGARIIEGAFTDMWENLLSGADNAFDTVLDGFKSLLANLIHQATSQAIVLNIQQGLSGTGTGPNGGINWQQLGSDFAQFASVIAGAQLGGGGQFAGIGSSLGGLAGELALDSLFPALGAALGSWAPIIGTAIGAVLGGLLGGLFDKDRPVQLNASGNQAFSNLSGSDTENILSTLFGDTFITSRRADPQAIQDVINGISEFDKAIGSFLDSDQIGVISDALKNWDTHLSGDAITLEQLLNSRFTVILSTFTDEIQDFVNKSADLTERLSRLEVGNAAQKLIDAAPDLFAGRTVSDFLAIVESFQDGTETITDAFNEVLALINMIGSAMDSLRSYADSDLGADFDALMSAANMSLSEALSGMSSAMAEAVANFDGSPEQLQQIGAMAMSVREGEIKLLQQIDSISKGIASNMQKLRDDLLGVIDGPKDRFALIGEAEAAIGGLATATTAEEIAALAQQFESAIRAMSPEDQAKFGRELIELVDLFETRSADQLEALKQNALDAAESSRTMVDDFLARIGDPIDFITEYSARQADSLDIIAETAVTKDEIAAQGEADRQAMSDVMGEGINGMTGAVNNIGPTVANAVRAGFSGVQIVVQSNNNGLVTQ